MTIKINAVGAERKRLVKTISEWLGCDAEYLGVPTCAYQVDYFTIERDGSLTFDDRADSEVIERLLEHIYDEGFDIDQSHTETGLTVEIPLENTAVGNLTKLLEAKGGLIRKALAVEKLPIEITDSTVKFPWFGECSADESKAYTHFISALCELAKNAKRVTAKEKKTDNDKYAFRCFLLRLGFIGAEFKEERKILLRNLTGSSAFRLGNGGATNEISE